MKKFLVAAAAALCAATLAVGARTYDKPVILSVDYSGKMQWVYSVDYTSQGSFKQKGSSSTKSTTVRCALTVSRAGGNKLAVKVDSAAIASDVLQDSSKKQITDQLLKNTYSLTLANGFPAIDSALHVAAGSPAEWDLYRQLARLLPTLPDKAVKPGFSWERTGSVSLRTARGTVPCEVYRTYTLSKLSGDTATVIWKFRYAASTEVKGDSDALSQIPVTGSGTGVALLDVVNRHIISAEMGFVTPVASIGNVDVVWQERAGFKLVSAK